MLALHGLSEISSFEHASGSRRPQATPWRRVPANSMRELATQRFDRAKGRCWLYLRVPPERRGWFRMLHLSLDDPHVTHSRVSWLYAPLGWQDTWSVDYIELFGTYAELPEPAVAEATPARRAYCFNACPQDVSVGVFHE
eukprot:gnl/TRDRNA2_/TRDRNA2_83211_c0_seq2.p1 gnl/TRDRNA2_/TRDRNA2_83211_c0~~gnl/TRDRNA2_/TRDRNA2_83211_c0_seq2.p1  ORF type:complete len:140 (-),score=13.46 gnl/TRDRNA2_/TRDRNA2_83211_c0_seq2:74-493(-)